MLKRLLILIIFSTVSIVFNGCAKNIVLHPMTDQDIKTEGTWVCMTPEYLKEVVKARLDK